MEFAEIAEQLTITNRIAENNIQAKCPVHPDITIRVIGTQKGILASCAKGCKLPDLLAALKPPEKPKSKPPPPPKQEKPPRNPDDFLQLVPPNDIHAENAVLAAVLSENECIEVTKSVLKADDFYRERARIVYRAMIGLSRRQEPIDMTTLLAILRANGELESIGGFEAFKQFYVDLAETLALPSAVRTYAQIVRDMAVKRNAAATLTELSRHAYNGVSVDGLLSEMHRALKPFLSDEPRDQVVTWEGFKEAEIANQDYLTRQAIVDGLLYRRTASLIVGGKHSGKTTNARTMALKIHRGEPVLGRETFAGPVLYCASEDEGMVVRKELLRMGWTPQDQLYLMTLTGSTLDPQALLQQISEKAKAVGAVFIVLDMLFDFAGIKDEMSYAGTREAAGAIYSLAIDSGAHVMATHHSPKYLSGGATAETAALGSQGIAARFSPIILSRHWGGDLYTIESTPPRDPRGKAIAPICLTLDENGHAITGQPFSDSMRWRVMAPRVLDAINSGEPGKHHTVVGLSKEMEINRPMMQTILYNLAKDGKIRRTKDKKSYKYYSIEGDQFAFDEQN